MIIISQILLVNPVKEVVLKQNKMRKTSWSEEWKYQIPEKNLKEVMNLLSFLWRENQNQIFKCTHFNWLMQRLLEVINRLNKQSSVSQINMVYILARKASHNNNNNNKSPAN